MLWVEQVYFWPRISALQLLWPAVASSTCSWSNFSRILLVHLLVHIFLSRTVSLAVHRTYNTGTDWTRTGIGWSFYKYNLAFESHVLDDPCSVSLWYCEHYMRHSSRLEWVGKDSNQNCHRSWYKCHWFRQHATLTSWTSRSDYSERKKTYRSSESLRKIITEASSE